ncbi:MAG: hypothetical protein ACXVA2_20220 [Mucilaginibacter sp.]
MMKDSKVDAHLKSLQRELAERIVHLAAFVDTCFGNGNGNYGNRLIESIDKNEVSLYFDDFDLLDLSKYKIGRNLSYFYIYAYHARCTQGIDWNDWDIDNVDQVFREFLELTDTFGVVSSTGNDPEWGTMIYGPGRSKWRKSGLWEMMNLCDARHRLDFDGEVSIADIALLANMNEKSVINALRAEGENQLLSEDGEIVKSSEALRWLRGRKSGFRETTFISFDRDELPTSLRYMEIAPFIKSRLEKIYENSESFWCDEAASLLGYSHDQLWSIVVDDINNLPIKDTHRIAKVIQVDPAWFTEQVFTALYPEQMELILYKKEIDFELVTDEQEKPYIEVNLTEKGIKNGYIDISEKLSDFFPKDCFGDRASDKQGNPIELRFGSEVRNTDIRVKSSITISPRARFGGYFNKVINAKPGDTLRIIKVDDRVFEIKHIPV